MRYLTLLLGALLALPFVLACPVTLSATSTDAFLKEVPTLNTALQGCPTTIPSPGDKLVGEGNFLLSITRTSGLTSTVLVTTASKEITGISVGTGTARWTVTMSEATLDTILAAQSRGDATARAYADRKISVRASTFFRGVGWFFVQPFVRRAVGKAVAPPAAPQAAAQAPGLTGKPKDCEDTYLPGHRQYVPNKALWDSYSADTDAVCQINRGTPGGQCAHGVQLSTDSGIPYYLCWYRT